MRSLCEQDGDMLRMQQEAEQRVREMRARSRMIARGSVLNAPAACAPPEEKHTAAHFDEEQVLLIGLAVLLYQCGCRNALLAVLVYLAA